MLTGNPEKAREFFAAKIAFTAGPFEVKGMIDRNESVTIIDVRAPADYAQGHVPGAVNLTQGLWHGARGLSRDKLHVLYCYSQTCHLAAAAAIELASRGYRVMEMEGGFAAWSALNLPVDKADCACVISA